MIVVDTNVLIYRCLPHPKSGACEAVLKLDEAWAAPLLWRSEFRNAMAGYIRLGRLGPEAAARAVDRAATQLTGGEYEVADSVVLGLVSRSACSAYDCEFAGLAEALDTILVTEDRALLSAFPARCRSLDDAAQRGLRP